MGCATGGRAEGQCHDGQNGRDPAGSSNDGQSVVSFRVCD
jgi:hypothetical protein